MFCRFLYVFVQMLERYFRFFHRDKLWGLRFPFKNESCSSKPSPESSQRSARSRSQGKGELFTSVITMVLFKMESTSHSEAV